MSDPYDPTAMGMRPWHLHDERGLVLCAGNKTVCRAVDSVADPAADFAGAPESHDGRLEWARFRRIRDCVNACAGVPDPGGVQDALALIWQMAEDEEHEGHEAAREAMAAMGFYRDGERVAETLMAEEGGA